MCQKSDFGEDCFSGDFVGCNFPVLWSILDTKIAPETKRLYSILELKTLFLRSLRFFSIFPAKIWKNVEIRPKSSENPKKFNLNSIENPKPDSPLPHQPSKKGDGRWLSSAATINGKFNSKFNGNFLKIPVGFPSSISEILFLVSIFPRH